MTKKRSLFLDFDGVIIDSIQAYCKTYASLYKTHTDYIEPKWWEINDWNFKSQCPLVDNPNTIFENELFFIHCEFMNPNTKEVIEKLANKYNVHICTIGTPKNIALKTLWINNNLPFITDIILLAKSDAGLGKSIVNMTDGVFVDDVSDNLSTSNAGVKICFGEKYSWNKDWDGVRLVNWTDVESSLL